MIDPGMTIDVALLPEHATVFDCVYVPAETPLLAAARARGLRRGERLGDAHRAGRDRVRALDRRERHGRRDARGGHRRSSPTPPRPPDAMRLPIRGGELGQVGRDRRDLHHRPQLPRSCRNRRSTRPERPLVYGKAASSVTGDGSVDRLGSGADRQRQRRVRAGRRHRARAARCSATRSSTTSPRRIRGSTATSGCSASRCPASARSVRGWCPPSELDAADLRLGFTRQRRRRPGRPNFADALLDRRDHRLTSAATSQLRPGDLIATGTPVTDRPRRADRHLRAGRRR